MKPYPAQHRVQPHAALSLPRRGRTSVVSTAVTFGLAMLLAMVMGLALAGGALLPVVVLVGGVVGFGLMLLGTRPWPQHVFGALTVGVTVVMLLAPSALHVTGVPVGYALEVLIFSMLVGALVQARRNMPDDHALLGVLLMFALYLVLSGLSSIAGRSHWLAAVWQFQYNMKWIGMFLIGALIVWDLRFERVLLRVVGLAWIPLAAGVVVEWAAPSVHVMLIGPPTDSAVNPFLGTLWRFRGPVLHSGYLALICAALAWVCLLVAVIQRRWLWLLPSTVYIALLVLSGQRQESFGLFMAAIGLLLWLGRRYWWLVLMAGAVLIAAGVVTYTAVNDYKVPDVAAQWGLGDPLHPLSERAILTQGGVQLGGQYFPLGAGLGTYGGAGAQKFDLSLFDDLGFGRYSWFRQGKFLVDVYWPSVIAESGWFAALLLMSCFLMLLVVLLRRRNRGQDLGFSALTAAGLLGILLSNTPSSAAITDPRGSFLLWLIIGAAWRRSARGSSPNLVAEAKSK